jgi:hypothetical protein
VKICFPYVPFFIAADLSPPIAPGRTDPALYLRGRGMPKTILPSAQIVISSF